MRQSLSPVAQAAYSDLLASLKDETASTIRGTPTRVERAGKVYWYDSFRVGSDVRKIYIGEDSLELRDLLARSGEISEARTDRQRHRARLIRILRAEGLRSVDSATGSLLNAMQRAGVFRLGGTIVGTLAFRLYEGELGVRYAFDQAAQTNDIDIASFHRLSLALEDAVSEPLQNVLKDFSFEPISTLDRTPAWRWKQTRQETLVEFLTPSFDEAEDIKPLAALGVHAQALHHLNYLLAEPIQAAVPYRSGVLVQIPRPEAFAIHKLIVADRRKGGPDATKAAKDRAQAAFLIDVLSQDRPDDLAEAYADAVGRGPRWRERITASLEKLPQSKSRLRDAGAIVDGA
jgi:hypothetical protein